MRMLKSVNRKSRGIRRGSFALPPAPRERMDPDRRERALIFLEVLIAILIPPLGVFLRHGCRVEFWICLLLTILGYIPGIIYAVYAIVVIDRDRYRYEYYQPIVA